MKAYWLDEFKKPYEISMAELDARWGTESRKVAYTELKPLHYVNRVPRRDIGVSTVFLCLDHNYSGEGEPILFETLADGIQDKDGKEAEDFMRRYRTWEQAVQGHDNIVAYLCDEFDYFEIVKEETEKPVTLAGRKIRIRL